MEARTYYVYLMSNKRNNVLYTGITGHLKGRVYQHKHKLVKGFTCKYNVNKLVYYEEFSDVYEAIAREKQIKGWLRSKKVKLIKKDNPDWKDISKNWF